MTDETQLGMSEPVSKCSTCQGSAMPEVWPSGWIYRCTVCQAYGAVRSDVHAARYLWNRMQG